jgi:hypothetical protein
MIKNLIQKFAGDKEKRKRLVVVAAGILVFLIIFITVLRLFQKEEIIVEKLQVGWEFAQLGMNIGEIRELKWKLNRDAEIEVLTESQGIIELRVGDFGVRIRALASGYDSIILRAEGQEAVCVVTVNDEFFMFESREGMVPEGGKDIFYIKAEPEELLYTNQVRYFIMDSSKAVVTGTGGGWVELQGLEKGYTQVVAEWRGKTTEFMLEVFERAESNIIVSGLRHYIFIDQETRVRVSLDDIQRGDERYFIFTREPGKNNIQVSWNDNDIFVKGLREGEQYVRVSHPRAAQTKIIYFDVLPPSAPPAPVIETSESPMILRTHQTRILRMEVVNGSGNERDGFSYRVIENGYAVNIEQMRDELVVSGIAPGVAKIRIGNKNVLREHDVMIIVE